MAKKTIEQLLKPVIAADLQALLTAEHATNPNFPVMTLSLVNDIRMASQNDIAGTVPGVVQTGKATNSSIYGIVMRKVPASIMFRVENNYLQEFLAILNTYAAAVNNYNNTVVDGMETDSTADDITYQYYFQWDTAQPVGDPFSVTVKKTVVKKDEAKEDTVIMRIVAFSGAIFHGINLPLRDTVVSLYIGTAWQEIKYEAEGAASLDPAFQSTLLVDQDLPEVDCVGDTHVQAFRVTRVPGDPVQDYILGLFYGSRTAISFDVVAKVVVTSLSITKTYNAKLSGIKQLRVQDGENLQFTVTMLDEYEV